MTETFRFDQKTGELERGGTIMTLRVMHARLFGALGTTFVDTAALAVRLRLQKSRIGVEVMELRKRLARLGIAVEARRGLGYRLVVGPMPPKWQPEIPPPVTIESVRRIPHTDHPVRSVTLSPKQVEERELRRAGYDARDLTSQLCGDPPRGFSALDQKTKSDFR